MLDDKFATVELDEEVQDVVDNNAVVDVAPQPLHKADRHQIRRRIEALKERNHFHETVCMVDGYCICYQVMQDD